MYRNKTKEVNIIIQWSPEIQKRLHTMANLRVDQLLVNTQIHNPSGSILEFYSDH